MCYIGRPIKQNNNRKNHKITMGHSKGCRKQQSSMRKPGIPPARIPRDHKEQPSRHDIHSDTLKQTPTKPGRSKVVRKTAAVKQESETWSKVKMTSRLQHLGHTQSPLRTAFPIIILHQTCGCGRHHCASGLATRLHGMGDCTRHQCVVISVH